MARVDEELEAAKEGGWKEFAAIDAAYELGTLGDAGWHEAVTSLVVPAYLAAVTAEGGSGSSRDAQGWEYARSLLADAATPGQTFLDIGCANGLLMESMANWGGVEPYGVEISPELAAIARSRLPQWAERIWVGNALDWEPPHGFDVVRTNVDYVPVPRRRALIERLLSYSERLLIGVSTKSGRPGRSSAVSPPGVSPSQVGASARTHTHGSRIGRSGSMPTTPSNSLLLGIPRPSLCERALLGHTGTPRKARGRRAELPQRQEPFGAGLELAGETQRDLGDRLDLGCGAHPDDRNPSRPHERETELRGHWRLRERFRERDPERVDWLLLRASPDHIHVRKLGRDTEQEVALTPFGFEQGERALGERDREGDPRRASSGPDVDDCPRRAFDQRLRSKRVLEQSKSRGGEIAEPCETRSRQHALEPALEELPHHVRR